MQDPPVQPDCCACSGNCSLEANPERHALTPLAAATGNWICRARCIQMVTEFLSCCPLMDYTGGTVFGICALQQPVTTAD
ncbi:hypothetical protein EYX55_26460 [Escherichia coli]|nr:hypothetical protein [Escherichia coli]EFA5327358.1 hypothetical protein [Escherichia coli]